MKIGIIMQDLAAQASISETYTATQGILTARRVDVYSRYGKPMSVRIDWEIDGKRISKAKATSLLNS